MVEASSLALKTASLASESPSRAVETPLLPTEIVSQAVEAPSRMIDAASRGKERTSRLAEAGPERNEEPSIGRMPGMGWEVGPLRRAVTPVAARVGWALAIPRRLAATIIHDPTVLAETVDSRCTTPGSLPRTDSRLAARASARKGIHCGQGDIS